MACRTKEHLVTGAIVLAALAVLLMPIAATAQMTRDEIELRNQNYELQQQVQSLQQQVQILQQQLAAKPAPPEPPVRARAESWYWLNGGCALPPFTPAQFAAEKGIPERLRISHGKAVFPQITSFGQDQIFYADHAECVAAWNRVIQICARNGLDNCFVQNP